MLLLTVLSGFFSKGQSTQVMLQGFDWTSSSSGIWYNTISSEASDIQAAKIDAIWLPPPSDAGSPQGYLPRQYYLLNTQYGTQAQLQSTITTLHSDNIKVLADIVINHRVGTTSWADFTNPTWDCSAVVSNDEWTGACGNPDTGEGVPYARDLDHTNVVVQNGIIAWMQWLKNTIGFDGWRYDFVLGYGPQYVKEYNDATSPYFSVAECWDPSATNINNWITNSQGSSAAFDFSLKGILQSAVQGNLGSLNAGGNPPGLIGINPAKAVTFIDNHDTGPPQNEWPFPSADVMEGYAYILTHPGIPMVFWDHLYTWGLHDQITTLINIRKSNGLTSTSSVSIQAASNNLYAAIIDGKVAMKIGSDSWSPAAGSGYVLKASGTNYAVWDKIAAPVITSNLTFTDTVGVSSAYYITASNTPTSFHATNLPAGLSIDTTTGIVSGASTNSGTYNVAISAVNNAGTNSQTLVITTNTATPPVIVTGVSVSPTTASINTTATTQLTATVSPSNATNNNVSWTSSNTAAATVSSTGLVTGISAGTATITATTADQNKTATATITVIAPSGFTVYFYKPIDWGSTINIYWWNALPSGVLANGTWPGVNMTSLGNNWYSYTFTGISSASIIFNDGTNQTDNLSRGQTGWYKNNVWYSSNPDSIAPLVNWIICPSSSTSAIAATPQAGNTYQWQTSTNGTNYSNISNSSVYSGATTDTLVLTMPSTTLYGSLYRCAIANNSVVTYSAVDTLQFGVTWTGSISSAWETAGNWNCSTLPDSNTDVYINGGTVILSSNVSVRSIRLSSAAQLTLQSGKNLQINGTLLVY